MIVHNFYIIICTDYFYNLKLNKFEFYIVQIES